MPPFGFKAIDIGQMGGRGSGLSGLECRVHSGALHGPPASQVVSRAGEFRHDACLGALCGRRRRAQSA